ncbi:hypothetical protein [Pseudomonas sp. MWU13-2105]|uniref:hypothetical protein n=1 Tax=Pseudomonas sp. MWU13-2105 TaxID=2935074 RepID=UPI00200CEBEF|nr:hypothetical protein [Pseudomonas sp. MWU13-2105]
MDLLKCAWQVKLSRAVALAGIVFLQGCSSQAPFNAMSISEAVPRDHTGTLSTESLLKQPFAPRYAVDGHYSTVGYVAQLAGYSNDKVYKLSCYSQTPDQEALHYSAPYVAIWGVFDPPFRHQVVNGLHSLHGGDARAIEARRNKLKSLIAKSIHDQRPEWELGFLIHALGDSYAHVHSRADGAHAYGEFAGHAIANLPWGERPDSIFVDHHYINYIEYVNALYDAFVSADLTARGDAVSLKRFTDEIAREAAKGDDAKKKVSFFMKTPAFDDTQGDSVQKCDSLNAKLNDKDIRVFLAGLSRALDN